MTAPVLIFKLGSLGDTVMALPFFHRIAELHPHARRVLLTNLPVNASAAPAEAILGDSGLVDDYVTYDVGLRSPGRLLALRSHLAAMKADRLFYLQECLTAGRAWRDYLFFRSCGLSRIVGAPLAPDGRRYAIDPSTRLRESECERFARTLAEIGPFDLSARASWDLRLTAAEREAGHAAIAPLAGRPILAINMGGKAAQNDWGRDNWHALVERLAERLKGFGLFAVGAVQDEPRAAEIGKLWSGPFANLCGKLLPRRSAAALEAAALFIGHDSGPLHLAAVSGVTCVGLYSAHNPPRVWHPYYGQHRIIHDMRGIAHITVDEVERAVLETLDRASLRAAV